MFQKLALLATMRRRQRRHYPGAVDLATTSVARRPSRAFAPQTAPPSIVPNSNLPGTILSVQVLRFVAALSVVLFHAHNALVSQLPGHAPDMIDHAFKVGASGVHVFFVISGFVMVYTSWRGQLTAGRFLSRRLIRIYPIYWVVAATYLGLHIILQSPYSLTVRQVAGAALLLPGDSPRIIGPGWTLSFEMYFYLCFAIALCAGLRRGIQLLTAFYVLSVGVGILLRPQSSAGHVLTDTLLLEFMAGAWLGYAFLRGLRVQPRIGGVMVFTSLLLFASGFWLDYERLPSVVAWGIPSLMLVAGALALERQLQSGIGRAAAKLGDSSYLLYLSHVLVIDVLLATPISLINRRESALLMAVGLATACAAIAAGGYEIVELPLLRALKRGSLRPSKCKVRESAAPQ